MGTTKTERIRTAIRRIRENITDAFHDHADPGASQPRGSNHVVPPHLAIISVMERDLATVLPESPLRPALRVMIENKISSVPVVDANRRIVGALNEGDLMRVFYEPDTMCVADVMTRNPIVVSITAPLIDVIDQLMSSDFRRVLIHENGRLVGVITRSHVIPALLKALEERAITRKNSPEPN